MDGTGLGALVIVGIVLFGLVLSVLWILLPIAVFGIRGDMRRMLTRLEEATELLYAISLRRAGPMSGDGLNAQMTSGRAKTTTQIS